VAPGAVDDSPLEEIKEPELDSPVKEQQPFIPYNIPTEGNDIKN
jgi:hypothetical protein